MPGDVAARKRIVLVQEDAELDGADLHVPEVDEALLAAERSQVVRQAMAHLPAQWQQLLGLLMADPPAPPTRRSPTSSGCLLAASAQPAAGA